MGKWVLVVGSLALVACNKDTGTAGKTDPGARAGTEVTAADVTAVNAAIPADWKGKIEFELGTIKSEKADTVTFKLAVPKGWKKGFMFGAIEPADADNFGSKTLGRTTMTVDTNCDGTCEPKDWAAVVDRVYYSQYTGGQVTGKLIRDDKRPNGRTLVFEQEPKVEKQGDVTMTSGTRGIQIITTWWAEGAKKHYLCTAELGEPAMPLAAAFEQACAKVAVE